jgi:hypothetical protein
MTDRSLYYWESVGVGFACRECGKRLDWDERYVYQECRSCRAQKAADKMAAHLASLRRKSLEERVALLEEQIYHHNRNHPSQPVYLRRDDA